MSSAGQIRKTAWVMALACALASVTSVSALAAAKAEPKFEPVLAAESRSRALCESVPGRILVLSITGSECVAYFVTTGSEKLRRAVLFFDGDAESSSGHAGAPGQVPEARRALLQHWADTLGVRYVYVSRVGLNGSSGNHADRRRPHETMIMNVAADILKAKLGLDSLVLAGQSGGSTIAASMLTLGRRDVVCAVLGSGAYGLTDIEYTRLKVSDPGVKREDVGFGMYDPSENIPGVVTDPLRRIFILGDHGDKRTPFEQQRHFVESLEAAGHHAALIAIDGQGAKDHATTYATIPAAGACARGDNDNKVVRMTVPERPSVLSAAAGGQ